MALFKTKLAKKNSYGDKRSRKDIRAIVIHYTGNTGDTAEGNANYFATTNKREAGAHFFVDKAGVIMRTIKMNCVAWSVGGFYSKDNGAGTYYNKYTNSNTVSIELCDCKNRTNWKQMVATRKLVNYIKKKCPNANKIVRHWDINGKSCPLPMIGAGNKAWNEFHDFLTGDCKFTAMVTEKVAIRTSRRVTPINIVGHLSKGSKITIDKLVGNWCRIQGKDASGKYNWVTINKIKEI